MKLYRMHWMVAALGCLVAIGPATAQIREHSLKLATTDPDGAAGPVGLKKMVELIDQKSGGKIKVKVFTGSILGNDSQMQAAIKGGTIDFALAGTPTLVGSVKELGLFDFPYMFRNTSDAYQMLDGPVGKKILAKLEDKGMIGLGFWEIGFRQITNNKRPITKWEDMSGIKMRVVGSPVFLDYFNGLGANAVPMPIVEVYSALETKAIDGEDNPIGNISALKFNEVQKYLSLTSHVYTTYTLMASKKIWDALNADERKLVMDAAEEAKVYERKVARDLNGNLLAEMKKTMQINEVSPAELARFEEKAKPVYEKFSKTVGEDLSKEWFDELAKVKRAK